MSEFTQFLADCWRLFQEVQVPVLNISFADLYIGVFVVGISIMILRPLLGIGGSGFASNIFHGLKGSGKRGYDRAYSKKRHEIMPKNPSSRDYDHQPYLPAHKRR